MSRLSKDRCCSPACRAHAGPPSQGAARAAKDAGRCVGYLTKYLTKQIAGCHQADTDAQRSHAARLAEALRYEPCFSPVRELAPLRHPAQGRTALA